jgi:GTP-binding protein HflX
VLEEIGAGQIPTVLAPNKIDVAAALPVRELESKNVAGVCPISALTGAGIEQLLGTVGTILDRNKELFDGCFSAQQGGLVALLRERGRIVKEIYDADGIHVRALVTSKLAGQMRKLLSTDGAGAKTFI